MKKLFSILVAALVCVTIVNAKTIYLNTGGSSLWNQAGAVFFAHTWGSGDFAAKMTLCDGDIYSLDIPDGNTGVIFLRQQGSSTSVDWDNCWNKTSDLTIPSDKNCYKITGWGGNDGSWSSYTPPTPDPEAPKFYITGDSALVVDAGAGFAKKWNADAIESMSDTFTLKLKAGVDYQLKVTVDGTWNTAKGYSVLTEIAAGLEDVGGNDHNIGFKLNTAGDVKVIYTSSLFKLIGDFYVEPEAKFYISGDSALVVDAGAGFAKKWNADAIKSEKDTFILNLKEGVDYQLKVVDGSNWKGYGDLTESEIAAGLEDVGGNDHNIGFKLNTAGDVKVIYTSSLFKLIGDFYVKPKAKFYISGDSALVVDAGLDASKKWYANAIKSVEDSYTLKNLKAGVDYKLRISLDGTWDKPETNSKGYNQLTEPIAEGLYSDGDNNICFKLDAVGDVTVTCTSTLFKLEGDFHKECQESYGLLVNGVYYAGTKNELQTSWKEYMLRNVQLTKGDSLQVRDVCADVNWVFTKFANTSHEFEIKNNKYVVDKTGTYDFYFKFIYENDEVYISQHGFYGSAVPSQCEDVMMQAFFNESYSDNAPGVGKTGDFPYNLGNTKWTTLLSQAEEIRSYFDLVWLPPSAYGEGMGYHPKNYSNQNTIYEWGSTWGTRAELENLIANLHGPDENKIQARVVADIVINHCQSTNGWLGFPEFDFGEYGKFYPTGAWVCKDDEVNKNPAAGSDYGKATGSYDDGENWDGARDWAHDMPEVQNMFKAYLQWMRTEMKYDGFRYDKGDGFDNWHHDNYNKAAGPYIAFMECYSNTDDIWWRIQKANYNLMALDFDTKWHMFDAIAGWDYNGIYDKWRGDGLLGRGNTKYAITFIDSHDWFLRSDNQNEFGGRGNSLTAALKARLLQANAFLLSMPGVPCVFYPHWKKYTEEIKGMIEARKLAGVHSESEIKDESATSSGYQVTIVGKYGYLILCLGDKAHQDYSNEYQLISSYYAKNDQNSGHDGSYQIWVNRTAPLPAEEYYLVGSKYNWSTADERLFTSTGTAGEYVLNGVDFEENDIIKVVKVVNNKFKAWYPGEDYIISSSEAGKKDIYFRPEAYEPWGGNIRIVGSGTPTSIDNTTEQPNVKVEKFVKDGQLYIRQGDKVYNMVGQTIK